MEDLQAFETECAQFDKCLISFNEAIAQFDADKEFGKYISMSSEQSAKVNLIVHISL